MIRVEAQPEPADFDARVRQPGLRARANNLASQDTWRECLDQLYNAYSGVCAYASFWIPQVTGSRSVEHFAPKSAHPSVAYEWSNYRLVCSLMNSRKREFEDVIDPFQIPDGERWFALEMLTLQVIPGLGLAGSLRDRVEQTIRRLGLNDPRCLRQRELYLREYQNHEITLAHLRKVAPFLALETTLAGF